MSTLTADYVDLRGRETDEQSLHTEGRMRASGLVRAARHALIALVVLFVVGDVLVITAGSLLGRYGVFNMACESNLPTWYSSVQLLAVCALAVCIAAFDRCVLGRTAWPWLVWAGGFAALSCDEIAMLHERVGHHLIPALGLDAGSVSEASRWVLVGGPVMLLVMGGLLHFLYKRLRAHPWCLAGMALGALLWTSVLVMEFIEEPFTTVGPDLRVARVLEESAEILGATVWLACLAYYLFRGVADRASELEARLSGCGEPERLERLARLVGHLEDLFRDEQGADPRSGAGRRRSATPADGVLQ